MWSAKKAVPGPAARVNSTIDCSLEIVHMNRIKAFYISSYVTLLVIFSAYAGQQLISIGFNWQWFGALLATLPMALFFIRLFVADVARTSGSLNSILIIITAGCAMTAWGITQQPAISLAWVQSFVVGLLGFLLYIHWYSRFADRTNQLLTVGASLPEFELQDTQGQTFNSQQLLGQPALMIFYRGNWCPLCMAQIKEVAEQYKSLAERGVQIALISPQPHDYSQKLADKFDVPFLFLVDKGNQAAKQLDILSLGGTPAGMNVLGYDNDTVMPTVLITDASGTIIFADLTDNYRVRPEPEIFIEIINRHVQA